MAADEQAPELRPKRPIYRSYGELIRLLTADAERRVKATKVEQIPPLKITAPIRRLGMRIVRLRTRLKREERQLAARHKAQVPSYCSCEDGKGLKVEWTYQETARLRETRPQTTTTKLDRIKHLRVTATLDTIDMTPRQAKSYLQKLEQTLGKISTSTR